MRIITTIFLLLFATSAFAESFADRAKNDDIAFMKDADPAMQRAFKKAHATLDDFLQKNRSHPPGTSDYAVKVGISDSGNTEYFWINDLSKQGDKFTGKINNEPRLVHTVRFGQNYTFTKSQIVDWVYLDSVKRRMFGNFTACALLTKEPASAREAMRKQYGLVCD